MAQLFRRASSPARAEYWVLSVPSLVLATLGATRLHIGVENSSIATALAASLVIHLRVFRQLRARSKHVFPS